MFGIVRAPFNFRDPLGSEVSDWGFRMVSDWYQTGIRWGGPRAGVQGGREGRGSEAR